jgi:beta-glucanase (GH16 family)
MKQALLIFLLFSATICSLPSAAQFTKLVWSDEFNYKGLPDSTKWGYDTGNNGWGNNELQNYTRRPENARVADGYLLIEARKENYQNSRFTSARLVSKNKGDWKYGRIEVKARLPKGRGLWPAIWMLPTQWVYGGWPKSGEIDIMENVGYLPDSVYGSIHTGSYNHAIGTGKTKGLLRTDLADSFHTYAINWTPEKITFFLDGVAYHEFTNDRSGADAWPFDQEFHLLLNVAVGGNWGGKFGVDERSFPQVMQIDYVRIYQ